MLVSEFVDDPFCNRRSGMLRVNLKMCGLALRRHDATLVHWFKEGIEDVVAVLRLLWFAANNFVHCCRVVSVSASCHSFGVPCPYPYPCLRSTPTFPCPLAHHTYSPILPLSFLANIYPLSSLISFPPILPSFPSFLPSFLPTMKFSSLLRRDG